MFRVYRFTLPSQGSYEKALIQLRNEILLLSTQLDGLVFLCHSLGGLLVAQMVDKLESKKILGIIAFDSPYFGLSKDVSNVALSKTSQTVVDPVQNVASTVIKTSNYVAKGVANVGYSVISSTKYVSNAVLSSTTDAITHVSETAVSMTQTAYKSSTEFITSPTQVISSTALYMAEIPSKTMNYMVEIPVRSWEVVGYTLDSGKLAMNKVFYGNQENNTDEIQQIIGEKSIKELEKEILVEKKSVYTENIKTPLVLQDEKDLGTSLFASPSDPWDSWIRLGLASVAFVSSGMSYTTPIGFAKNLTRNLLLAHGVSALNEARKTIQFLYPPLWGDSVSSITERMLTLTDRIYFKCFYVVRLVL